MNQTENALVLAESIGGKNRLNCIAELDETAPEQAKAKEIAVQQKRRAIILETQSCNTKAIGFYLHQGFELIGLDTCCYTNDDIGRREVRINLGFFFHREGRRR